VNEDFWKKFYAKPHTLEPTPFAVWADLWNRRIVDFGCGNGRDTLYFSGRGNTTVGVDLCAPDGEMFCKTSIEDFIANNHEDWGIAYCRFLFHAIEKPTQDRLLDWVVKNHMTLYAEFRSDQDNPKPGHERRLLSGDLVLSELLARGFHVHHYHEGQGLAKFKGEDPHVVRIVASVPNPALKDPSFRNPLNHEAACAGLRLAGQILSGLGITYWLSNGTLLGCMREHDFIAHDNDMDLGIWASTPDHSRIVAAFEAKGFRLMEEYGEPGHGHEFAFETPRTMEGRTKLDLFFYTPETDNCWMPLWVGSEMRKMVFPPLTRLVTASFCGTEFPIPANWKEFLIAQYGPTWATKDPGYHWSESPLNLTNGQNLLGDTTAIIKTFLRDDYLFDCVASLRTTYPHLVISIADDGPPSQEREFRLKELGVSRYISMPFDSGLSAGRNALLDACETPYILIGDDDFLYTPETHVEYLRALMGTADIAAGGTKTNGKLLRYETGLVRRANGSYDLTAHAKWPPYEIFKGVRFGRCDLALNFFVARAEVVRRIRWDERLRIRYEHEDFFMTAQAQKARVVYCPDSVVQHKAQGYLDSTEYLAHREDFSTSAEEFARKWGFIWD
jgi:GT2 family glycosyltransferase/SAM-dependent methyltransferase